MRLDRLELVNFRGFERFTLELHPEFTLLIGTNGSGKTALLDAATIAVKCFVAAGPDPGIEPAFERSDLRLANVDRTGLGLLERQAPGRVNGRAVIGAETIEWSDERTLSGSTRERPTGLREWWRGPRSHVANGEDGELPVVASFGVGRGFVDRGPVADGEGASGRADGWLQWWRPNTDFGRLIAWMRRHTYADIQQGTRLPHLAGVQRAVATCLGDVEDLYYDVRADELRARFADGRVLPMAVLSDGYRGVISMVADLAWRAATLNPHLGANAAAKSPGIVLIDEIDLHLHPGWQRRVIDDLRRTFPRFQFVATTHSPQVLASALPDWVRLLAGGETALRVDHVHGRDSNSLLEDVFGVPERPADAKQRIETLFERIDRSDHAAARTLLAELEAEVGPDDADLVRARWMLDAESP